MLLPDTSFCTGDFTPAAAAVKGTPYAAAGTLATAVADGAPDADVVDGTPAAAADGPAAAAAAGVTLNAAAADDDGTHSCC